MYFLVRWLCTAIVRSFFKQVTVLHSECVPLYGPVIFVGNHNNQFIDATMLVASLPRRVRFLVAYKSMKRRVIGFLARFAGSIVVRRQRDESYVDKGKIRVVSIKENRVIKDWDIDLKSAKTLLSEDSVLIIGDNTTEFRAEIKVGDVIKIDYQSSEINTSFMVQKVIDRRRLLTIPKYNTSSNNLNISTAGGLKKSNSDLNSYKKSPNYGCNDRNEHAISAEILTEQMHKDDIQDSTGKITGGKELGSNLRCRFPQEEEEKEDVATSNHMHEKDESTNFQDTRNNHTYKYCEYMVIPKINQLEVYASVTKSLVEGDTLGIFPEGGSHDRPTLLPLKAGVAIMAISAIAAGSEEVLIVPVGMTYHNPHKTQSRATVCIGDPIPITQENVVEYQENRREATSRILDQVAKGLRSCIITAQDLVTMRHIKLCCSVYPPERLRMAEDKYFILHKLVSKIFWKEASDPRLLELRRALTVYMQTLDRRSILDHHVWMLKQSPSGATFMLVESLVSIFYCSLLGLPLLPLWGPLRVIAYLLAERHRASALAASSVKLKGMDVVASYKVIVLLVLVPLFNVFYGLIFGLLFLSTWTEVACSIVLAVILLPPLYYFSMRHSEKLLPLLRRLRLLLLVVIGSVNVWRDTDKELITQRTVMQVKVRETIFLLGQSMGESFMVELQRTIPTVLLDADNKRLIRKREDFAPLQMTSFLNNAEEIL